MKSLLQKILALSCLLFLVISCETEAIDLSDESKNNRSKKSIDPGPYEFSGAIFDISATPDGGILVGVNNADGRNVQVIKNGKVRTMTSVNSNTDLQGIDALGSGNAFVTTAGTDLAVDGELYRVSYGNAKMVADLGDFEQAYDPDAFEGPQWKDQQCEATGGFSAGPQNNPYKVKAWSGSTALVADAAGNTVLSATTTGEIDYLAILTPPLDNEGNWLALWNAGESGEIPCYVQPVPTSVAIGPNGDIFVGELTGALAPEDGVFPIGRSRVWRINAGANNVVLSQTDPSPDGELLIDGLTSVIDLEIGPDGLLYVVEFDESSWFSAFIPFVATGGTISSYDLDGNLVEVVASGLEFPSAITFDKWGNLWLLENNATFGISGNNPTVRILD